LSAPPAPAASASAPAPAASASAPAAPAAVSSIVSLNHIYYININIKTK